MIEFFAGSAMLTQEARARGHCVARLDIMYGTPRVGSAMDITSPSGMAPLSCSLFTFTTLL